MKTTRLNFDLDPIDADRLPYLVANYDRVMEQPAPDVFNDMVQWAYMRQGAQAELARFMRKLYDYSKIETTPAPSPARVAALRDTLEHMVRWRDQLSREDIANAEKILLQFPKGTP